MGAGGGSSDVVPNYTVSPIDGIRDILQTLGNSTALVKLILVDDANASATVDGIASDFQTALAEAANADAVILMAGTIAEEGADRATFTGAEGTRLATRAADGSSIDWYAARPSAIATNTVGNTAKHSGTVAMIKAVIATTSTTPRSMVAKTALVLKDNAGVAMDRALVGRAGPSILEVWFPGQEDGHIVAELLFGVKNPSGKLPVTFPFVGKGYLDSLSAAQYPGVVGGDGVTQTVEYTEKLHIGYRWYDANISGQCALVRGVNPCVAFPFGHGLSYTSFSIAAPSVTLDRATGKYTVKATVANTGSVAGSEVVQVYLSLPPGSSSVGAAQPPKRLVGFQKVELTPGSSKDISVIVDPAASHHPLSVWSTTANRWVTPAGTYTVHVGTSSSPKDLVLAGTFTH